MGPASFLMGKGRGVYISINHRTKEPKTLISRIKNSGVVVTLTSLELVVKMILEMKFLLALQSCQKVVKNCYQLSISHYTPLFSYNPISSYSTRYFNIFKNSSRLLIK